MKNGDDAVFVHTENGCLGENFNIRVGENIVHQHFSDMNAAVSGVLFFRAEELVGLFYQLSAGNVISFTDKDLSAQGGSSCGCA